MMAWYERYSLEEYVCPPFPAKSKKDNNYNINPNGIDYIKYHIGVDFQKVIINTFILLSQRKY